MVSMRQMSVPRQISPDCPVLLKDRIHDMALKDFEALLLAFIDTTVEVSGSGVFPEPASAQLLFSDSSRSERIIGESSWEAKQELAVSITIKNTDFLHQSTQSCI